MFKMYARLLYASGDRFAFVVSYFKRLANNQSRYLTTLVVLVIFDEPMCP
jgi:hypothetical protein